MIDYSSLLTLSTFQRFNPFQPFSTFFNLFQPHKKSPAQTNKAYYFKLPSHVLRLTSYVLKQRPTRGQTRHDDRDHGHELDQDIQAGTGCIFEGITDSITGDSRFVSV